MSSLVALLGNPGLEYSETRHNIAWMVGDLLERDLRLSWKDKFKGLFAIHNGHYFIKPLTYMNLSGASVQAVSHYYKIGVQEILVVHDELDLPFGQLRFKKGGGTAGHNGLKSIANCLGDQGFIRLRIGIGRPKGKQAVSSFVLSKFSNEEDRDLQELLEISAEAITEFLKNGFEKAANKYSKVDLFKEKKV